jgi:cation diffusion facilitator CzcD-associated flavoprotein CzcO
MLMEPPEHVDVLIVGAGLSGVGAACHLQRSCPGKSFAILESREAIGGTWDLFRYPGIRSDSDMFTLGYSFRPWPGDRSIADGPSILSYVRETAREHGVEEKIRFGHRVVGADWSSGEARWTVHAQRTDTGESVRLSCAFLYCCTGYYRYEEGYSPSFPGAERFAGQIVHPQHWPEDLDYEGKRVVVIGSGATAVTLVPAMAGRAEHVTMLQRSPTYIVSLPAIDPIAVALRRRLPANIADAALRWKNVALTMLSFNLSRRAPKLARRLIRRGVVSQLPADFDVDTHFNPDYNPWQQRLCLVPDGDLFKAIGDGSASIATDRIDTFTETGLKLASGAELQADIIVSATGLNLLMLGGLELALDGAPVEMAKTVGYKGMMLCGVPNMAFTVGYTNASWTLKADLVADYVCRLLGYMDEHSYAAFTPQGPDDPAAPTEPMIDLQAGYVLRSLHELPRQGTTAPWRLHQNYFKDLRLLKRGSVDDHMSFARAAAASSTNGVAARSAANGTAAPANDVHTAETVVSVPVQGHQQASAQEVLR